jgi:uncharacterized protein (TIGR00251 family)
VWLRETPDGIAFAVRVIPRAGASTIAGTRDGRLLIRLAAAPVDGAANKALVAFLSDILRVPAVKVSVKAGLRNRNKLVVVEGLTLDRASALISPAAGRG